MMVYGRKIICERCGKEAFQRLQKEKSLDGGFTKAFEFEDKPEGWKTLSVGDKYVELCCECSKTFSGMCDRFMGIPEKGD